MFNIPLLNRLLVHFMHRQFGGEVTVPKFSTTASANTPQSGNIFYCIKPLGGDATISSAKDANGNVIAALAGIVISKGDEYKEYLSEVTFSDTTVVRLYERVKTDQVN